MLGQANVNGLVGLLYTIEYVWMMKKWFFFLSVARVLWMVFCCCCCLLCAFLVTNDPVGSDSAV